MKSLILPTLLVLSIFACKKPGDTSYLMNEYDQPEITSVNLRDTLPKNDVLSNLFIQESKGVKAIYKSGRYTCYFEYKANQQDILKIINTLPFDINTRLSDTQCRKMNQDFSLTGKGIRSEKEIESSTFFWDINPEDFVYYECIKSPMRHTLLLDKHSNRILHRIDLES